MSVTSGWGNLVGGSGSKSINWLHCSSPIWQQYVILADEIAAYRGHFQGGRMWLCGGEQCALCADGLGSQDRWVMQCLRLTDMSVGFLEVGRSVATIIKQCCDAHGAIRGTCFEMARQGISKHSAIRCRFYDGAISDHWAEMPIESPKEVMENFFLEASPSLRELPTKESGWRQKAKLLIEG